MPARGYVIRSYKNGKSSKGSEYRNYSLTVPTEIAEALPTDIRFQPEMTDEGLLYRPTRNNGDRNMNLPEWAQSNSESESKTSHLQAVQ